MSSPPSSDASQRRRIAGKRVLVTGASSGIGAAVARLLDAEGAACVVVGRDQDRLAAVAAELGHERTTAIAADVADPEAVENLLEQVFASGALDVVVNSAGVCRPRSLIELDPAAWRQEIEINLSGSFYVGRGAGLRMREAGGGTIVNLGSDKSTMGAGMYVAYCASKAGVLGLTRGLAVELAPEVTVNALCPGPVWTPMIEAELELFDDPEAARSETIEQVPLGRYATAAEVAQAILFLAGDAPYATGALIPLDGGLTIV